MSGTGKRSNPPRPGRARQADVARAAGVHPSTVSLALRAETRGLISPEVAARIRAAAERLGYQPDTVAASMRTGRSRSIAMLLHDIADPVYPPIVKGVESVAREAGYVLISGNTAYDAHKEASLLDNFLARRVDGVILATTRLEDPLVDTVLARGVPLVSVFRRPANAQVTSIVNDCDTGMRAIVEHLQQRGHRNLALLSAPTDISSGRERRDGFLAALWPETRHRIEYLGPLTAEEGFAAAGRVLADRSDRPDAIVCVNDLAALGAYRALRDAGLRCPQDISVTGFNDLPFTDMLDPPLTTVRVRLYEMGIAAGRALLGFLNEPPVAPSSRRLPCEVRLRGSVIDRR